MPIDLSKNKSYFQDIVHKIDVAEHPEMQEAYIIDENAYGTVDGRGDLSTIVVGEGVEQKLDPPEGPSFADLRDALPKIDAERIDGAISLYEELNATYGLKFSADKVTSISETFKSIINPIDKETFEIYLREYIDRLRLACLNQLANTVYSLIMKLTSPETIQSLTISERVALLDRLFEYMDKVNNMATLLPRGDTSTELKEIATRIQEDDSGINPNQPKARNRELESFLLGLLK